MIMILDVDVTAEWRHYNTLSPDRAIPQPLNLLNPHVRILHRMRKSAEVGPRRTMVSFIGMLTLVHPFATTWHFPSRGNEKFRGAFRLSADRPRMTSVRREEIEAALVMGWPLDSVILNAVKNLGAWRG